MKNKNNKIFTKKRAAGIGALIIGIAIILTGTLAYALRDIEIDESENSPGTGSGSPDYYAKLISPDFNQTGWKTTTPTADTTKNVAVANIGEGNIWVRVNLTEKLNISTIPIATTFGDTSTPAIFGDNSTAVETDKIRTYVNAQTSVKTIDEWIEEGSPNGAFWILDKDGWFYWGQAIDGCEDPAQALQTEGFAIVADLVKKPSNAFAYTISAKLQAVSDDLEGLDTANGWNLNMDASVNPIAELFGDQRFVTAEYDYVFSNVTDGELRLEQDNTYQLIMGTTIGYTPTADITWNSSNESAATVSETGMVTGITPGTTTVTATGPKGSVSVEVTVYKVDKFIFTIDTSLVAASGTTFKPQINSNSNNSFTIDWGDGSIPETRTNSNRNDSHVYKDGGTYNVTITGDVKSGMSFYNEKRLTEVQSALLSNTATSMNSIFSGCTNLVSIPKDLFDKSPAVTTFMGTFNGCSKLTTIPTGLFENNKEVQSFEQTFIGCSNLTAIPEGLFDNNKEVTSFIYTFSSCKGLTLIPEGLFDNNEKVGSFNNTFSYMDNLSTIPTGLFANNKKVTSFEYTFASCKNLMEIPEGLFDENEIVVSFKSTFSSCQKLTAIPANMFDNNVKVTSFESTFNGCGNLEVIPAGLFDKNKIVTSFSSTFQNCKKLIEIPSGLFDNNVEVQTFAGTFAYMDSLNTIPTGLFDNNIKVTTFAGVFSGPSLGSSVLTTIPAGLFDNNVKVMTFQNAFNYTSIETIPSDLFKYNTEVENFYGTFLKCYELVEIPAGLFDNNRKVTNFEYTFAQCKKLKTIPVDLFDNNKAVTSFSHVFYSCSAVISNVPELWVTHSSVADKTLAFTGCTKAINYTSIPVAWK